MFGRLKGYLAKSDSISRELYRSIYCGTCYALGENLGLFGHFLLSNEMVAAFALTSELSDAEQNHVSLLCPFAGIKPRKRIDFDKNISRRIVDIYLLLLDMKLDDDIHDERGYRKLVAQYEKKIFTGKALDARTRLASNGFPVDEFRQLISSDTNCDFKSLDDATYQTGRIFGSIAMEIGLISNRVDIIDELKSFGSAVGQVLTLIDMLDDLPSDMKLGRHNPIARIYGKHSNNASEILRNARDDILYLAREYLCDIAFCLSALKPVRHEELLRGIFGRSIEKALSNHFSSEHISIAAQEEVFA
jgi:hypothetical protein